MSNRHLGKLGFDYSLPAGCELLTFSRTDGDSAQWPQNTVEVEDEDGNVNFYKPIPDQQGMSLKWLHQVGQKVADMMGLPKDKSYALAGWPDGYGFFDHHKGARASPRHDNYLIGCTTVSRFRSIPEFVPHALWLMTDAAMDRAHCKCKYCSRRQQSAVSQQFGYTSQVSRSSAGPTISQLPSKRRRRNQQPYAVVQRTKALKAQTEQAQAAKKRNREKQQETQRTVQLEPPRETAPNERITDLRSAAMRLGPERVIRRFHRQGELVWCMLASPIRAGPPGEDGPKIDLWPAIISEWSTVTTQVPRVDYEPPPPGPINTEAQAWIDAGRPRVPAGHFYGGENQAATSWINVHRTQYTAQLLAINAKIRVFDDCVLPYSAWAPAANLLSILRDIPPHMLQYYREFCPPGGSPDITSEEEVAVLFTHAAAPYSIALEAAAELAATWSVTDEWIAEILNTGGEEEQETRYQGLWWGPERIWVGDLVQLKMPRKQLHSPYLHEPYKAADAQEDEIGAGDRGVFMHLRSLKHVETLLPDNVIHSGILASGELYEVAEDSAFLTTQVPQGVGDEARRKTFDAAKRVQEKEVDEAARGVEGLDMSLNGNGKGKEREDVAIRPTGDVAPAPVPSTDVTLPYPDSTVPTDQTVSAMHETLGDVPSSNGTPANGGTLQRTDIGGLSGPTQVDEILPPAPPPFAFRPLIIQSSHEAAVSLDLLGGRYYPAIIQHPLLAPIRQLIVDGAINRPDELPSPECEALLALEGISPAWNCAMSPTRMIIGRKSAIMEAEARAVRMLQGGWTGEADEMDGMQVNKSMGPEGAQRGGTWPVSAPGAGDGLASLSGNGSGMDIDLPGTV